MDSIDSTLKPDRLKEKENKLVSSFMTLRNLIGFCGIILPVFLILFTKTAIGDKPIESSISEYYYTSNGDLLVVLLCILGAYLITYKGYDRKDNILSSIAAICAIGAAFSPTAAPYPTASFSVHTPLYKVHEIFGIERHLIFATIFFLSLSLISLYCFTKTDASTLINNGKLTQKGRRNIVFKICGGFVSPPKNPTV
jgi:hypothetical protein